MTPDLLHELTHTTAPMTHTYTRAHVSSASVIAVANGAVPLHATAYLTVF